MTYPLGGSATTVDIAVDDLLTTVSGDTRATWQQLVGTSRTVAVELVDLLAFATADSRTWVLAQSNIVVVNERNPTFPQLLDDFTIFPTAL